MPSSIRRKTEQKSLPVSKRPNKRKESIKKSRQTSTERPKQHLSLVDCHSLQEGLALASLPVPSEQALKEASGSTKGNLRNGKETRSDNLRNKTDAQLICVCEEGFSDGSKERCLFCGHKVSKHAGSNTFTIDGIHSRNPRLPKAVQREYMEAEEYMRKMTVQLKQLNELMQTDFV